VKYSSREQQSEEKKLVDPNLKENVGKTVSSIVALSNRRFQLW
jgi:hypothetical protein